MGQKGWNVGRLGRSSGCEVGKLNIQTFNFQPFQLQPDSPSNSHFITNT